VRVWYRPAVPDGGGLADCAIREISMCGTIGTARQAGGNARHAIGPPGTPVRIPPLADPQGNDVTGRWPLRSFLELGALPSAIPCARLHTRQVAWEWRVRRKLHLMRIGDCVRAWRLPGADTQCDLAVQRREVSGEANGWLSARGVD
jgi:hypothetical protein